MFEVDAQSIHVLPGLPTPLEMSAASGINHQPVTAQPPAYQQAPPVQPLPQPTAAMPLPAVGVTAASPTVNLTDLTADDFLTEDDIPF